MFRSRQKTTTGCLRCRQRRKKCDELKPVCSYCQRWRLECEWSDKAVQRVKKLPTSSEIAVGLADIVKLERRAEACPSFARIPGATDLNPFDRLPLRHSGKFTVAPDCLHRFFASCTDGNTRYTASDIRSEIIRGWLESCFLDEAACAAQITYWAKRVGQKTKNPSAVAIGLQFETLTISCLMSSINSGAPASEEMLLAATVHFIAATIDLSDTFQLQTIVKGVKTMVDALGGIDTVLRTMRLSTILSVLTCDAYVSVLVAEPPSFVRLEKPQKPLSLLRTQYTQPSGLDLSYSLTTDVIEMFEEVGFLLLFRPSSKLGQHLSARESRHLFFLHLWIDYRFGILQASLINTSTLSEICLFALVIVRQEVLADESIHLILISTLLKRLRDAIERCQLLNLPMFRIFSTWASVVALVGVSIKPDRLWFAEYFHMALCSQHGRYEEWPADWDIRLFLELEQLLWDDRIAQRYATLCADLKARYQFKLRSCSQSSDGETVSCERYEAIS